jgi:AraC-like DNA-binding protein
MGVIAALIPHQGRLQRLRSAVRDVHTILAFENWEDLFQAADQQVIHLAVLDLEAAGAPNFDPVRRLKLMLPRISLIAYVVLTPDRIRQVFDAGRYGFEELVIADTDDGPITFGRAIDKAAARGIATLLRRGISEAPNPIARDALMIAVTRAHEIITPSRLAKIVGVSSRRLSRQLADAGYPSASRTLTWGRLLVAGEMLGDSRHSGAKIAMTLHFPSASAFRNTCQRYLGVTPADIRARGGATFVLESFKQELKTPAIL